MSESMESRLQAFENDLPEISDYNMKVTRSMYNPRKKEQSYLSRAYTDYLLCDLFNYLKNNDSEREFDTLWNLLTDRYSEVNLACLKLAHNKKFSAAEKVLKLISDGRLIEFHNFYDRLFRPSTPIVESLRYLDTLFSRQPQTLNEMRPDDHIVQQILAYTAQAGMNFQQQQEFNEIASRNLLILIRRGIDANL